MWNYNHVYPYSYYAHELYHHGVKGQKWGVRNGPPYPLSRQKNKVAKSDKTDIIKTTVSGHKAPPKQSTPNSIIDRVAADGTVNARAFYDEQGMKSMEIHTTNHGNPKQHPYGEHGEHMELYEWNDDGTLKQLTRRDLTVSERKENADIL